VNRLARGGRTVRAQSFRPTAADRGPPELTKHLEEIAMPHVQLPEGLAGIVGPMKAYPETAKHLNGLAEALLRGQSSLTPGERETIATFVSSGNECRFCTASHAATARQLLGADGGIVDRIMSNFQTASVSPKLRALLVIAEKVRQGGRRVTDEEVANARREGADDKAIHDTVLIAAAFCMFNRYVDGLATTMPADSAYEQIGAKLARYGYLNSVP
jgi:uncharacterized peroxidase-related enzyme